MHRNGKVVLQHSLGVPAIPARGTKDWLDLWDLGRVFDPAKAPVAATVLYLG